MDAGPFVVLAERVSLPSDESAEEAHKVLVRSQGLTITLQPPTTLTNFREYNRQCTNLDSDYLMQPINEAEYDSETQACVDRVTGGPKSFFEHYTAKPIRKKGRGVGCECPAGRETAALGTREGSGAAYEEDFLRVPAEQEVPPGGARKGALRDPVTRRLATGRMPPPP